MTNARTAHALGLAVLLAAGPAGAQAPSACPSPQLDTRALTAQLQQQTAQLGTVSPEVNARVGVMQSVLQAREAAATRGECDLSQYDAQLKLLSADIVALVQAQGAASPAAAPAAPPPAGAAASAPAGPTAQGAPDLKSEVLSKVSDALQGLLGKLGSSAPTQSSPPPPSGSSSPIAIGPVSPTPTPQPAAPVSPIILTPPSRTPVTSRPVINPRPGSGSQRRPSIQSP